ncbi:type VI secretion system baseplate subunit TssF [Entomomonas moraniae]|uniref:Type VI secretion system baseplate subunit TssF n=1 Tax=Entomomonas moraniae TaxID=2213226 RepID=A0A3Q9JJR7_9GAMM|nr:type VI secretion system baseplate subunit TssF [Entomomonas moraniae]AZS51194.1 type VI secretion system baseplate subunit TssF [Entomomonas moraniae]
MSFNYYYLQELTALRRMGKQFAQRNPALAPFIGDGSRDPDVERLLESFAFLTGRLRQRLDDELPELAHSLMNLLWPNYMRSLPAFSIIEFDALDETEESVTLARHSVVNSTPVEGTVCQFQTCYETKINALDLDDVDYAIKNGGAVLSLKLMLKGEGNLVGAPLDKLRLHLTGERYISQMLYLCLLRHIDTIQLVPLNEKGESFTDSNGNVLGVKTIGPEHIKAVGYAEDEALLPYPENTFRGYRYIQEYFAFQDKFLFVDLERMDTLKTLPEDLLEKTKGIMVRFNIRRANMQRIQPTKENIKLNCTPVVNLFSHNAMPINFTGTDNEYHILPSINTAGHYEVFSVDKVIGWSNTRNEYKEYVPFESFEHDASFDVDEVRPFYFVRKEKSLTHDGLDTYLRFASKDSTLFTGDTLSIDLTCTNQNLPTQLRVGDICVASETIPDNLVFKNIVPPTTSYAPPIETGFLWRIISNMSLNYLSLADIEPLKVVLETYDFPRYYDQQHERISRRLLAGLKDIKYKPVDRLHKGLPFRGIRTELTIDPEGYIGDGDLFLFASVLNEFFILYVSLNSFHELVVHSTHNQTYRWPLRIGQQALL